MIKLDEGEIPYTEPVIRDDYFPEASDTAPTVAPVVAPLSTPEAPVSIPPPPPPAVQREPDISNVVLPSVPPVEEVQREPDISNVVLPSVPPQPPVEAEASAEASAEAPAILEHDIDFYINQLAKCKQDKENAFKMILDEINTILSIQ